MSLLDEGIHAREQDREERRRDRAPQCEREQANAAAEATAHELCRDAGLNDR